MFGLRVSVTALCNIGRAFYFCVLGGWCQGLGFNSPCGWNYFQSHLLSKIILVFKQIVIGYKIGTQLDWKSHKLGSLQVWKYPPWTHNTRAFKPIRKSSWSQLYTEVVNSHQDCRMLQTWSRHLCIAKTRALNPISQPDQYV